MKAVICSRYGSPDFMQIADIPIPTPKESQVLVKIRAGTVTAGDCEIRTFKIPVLFWIPLRIIFGITRPKPGIFGQEFSGDVETIGDGVTQYKKGDAVFGFTTIRLGAHAQYICLNQGFLTPFNRQRSTYAAVATIPTGGINGLHLVMKAAIQRGESVLINGAGGSIGTYAVQLARSYGAEITCVDSERKLDMLRNLGSDRTIDYTKEDFTNHDKQYDVIIDIVGRNSYSRMLKSLKPAGRYIMGNPSLTGICRGLWTSLISKRKVIFQLADYKKENLMLLRDMIEEQKLKPAMDRCYPLEETAAAHRYVESGLKRGNVIIEVNHEH